MEPSCAPDLPTPEPSNVKTEKLPYTESTSTKIEFSYKWKIPQWSTVNERMLKSPVFSPGVNNRLKWSLILYPRGTAQRDQYSLYSNSQDRVSLYLCSEHCINPEVTATFTLSVLDSYGAAKSHTIEMTKPWTFKHGTNQSTYGYDKFVTRNQISNCVTFKQALIILCEIQVHNTVDSFLQKKKDIPFKIPNSQLLDDIELLFKNQRYTDFTIVVDAQEFPVHKAILAARSSVFAAMFEYDTEEQKHNEVNVTDTSPEVLKELLRFIYTDKVTDIEKVALDLLASAEKYALDRLKLMCEEALRKSLAIQNAAEILMHADLHRADQLKSEAIKFINTHIIETMDTDGFKSMVTSHPYLVAEILRASAMQKETEKVRL